MFNVIADYVDMTHAFEYLSLLDDEARRTRVLRSIDSEPMVHAILAFLLSWTMKSLRDFVSLYPKFEFLEHFEEDRRCTYVYRVRNCPMNIRCADSRDTIGHTDILFLRCAYKLLRKYHDALRAYPRG